MPHQCNMKNNPMMSQHNLLTNNQKQLIAAHEKWEKVGYQAMLTVLQQLSDKQAEFRAKAKRVEMPESEMARFELPDRKAEELVTRLAHMVVLAKLTMEPHQGTVPPGASSMEEELCQAVTKMFMVRRPGVEEEGAPMEISIDLKTLKARLDKVA